MKSIKTKRNHCTWWALLTAKLGCVHWPGILCRVIALYGKHTREEGESAQESKSTITERLHLGRRKQEEDEEEEGDEQKEEVEENNNMVVRYIHVLMPTDTETTRISEKMTKTIVIYSIHTSHNRHSIWQ